MQLRDRPEAFHHLQSFEFGTLGSARQEEGPQPQTCRPLQKNEHFGEISNTFVSVIPHLLRASQPPQESGKGKIVGGLLSKSREIQDFSSKCQGSYVYSQGKSLVGCML